MSKRASEAKYPNKTDWQTPLRDEEGKWYPVIRVGRHVPFGYRQDEDDPDLLLPVEEELELLEKAKLFLREYSLRQVAQWLSKNSGRYISHVGLDKRVRLEEKRRKASSNYRQYARKYKEAARKAKKIDEERLGVSGIRRYENYGEDIPIGPGERCPFCGHEPEGDLPAKRGTTD